MVTAPDGSSTLIAGGNTSFVPTMPGSYSVSQLDLVFGAQLTKENALIVCNAPSGDGMSFRDEAHVSMPSPLTERTYKYTLDWWMMPKEKTDSCVTMHEPTDTEFRLTIGAKGVMTVVAGDKTAVTPEGFVIADEWHHYALVFYYSRFYFYRDGVLIHNVAGPTASPAWEGFLMEGQHCVIDEFRFWASRLTQDRLREICVAPLANPEAEAASSAALTVYLNFDKFDAETRNASNLAVPSNSASYCRGVSFEPSDGVFGFDFSNAKAKSVDVTADYLTNYRAPFLHTSDAAIDGYASRFCELEMNSEASRWGTLSWNEGLQGLISVDTHRSSALLLQSSWYGPAMNGDGCFLGQVVKLPAGCYTFSVSLAEATDCWRCSIHASAMQVSAPLTDGSVSFMLPYDSEVTLGIDIRLPAYGRALINSFRLVRHPVDAVEADGEVLPTGIQTTSLLPYEDESLYDLSGRRVLQPANAGIYIQKGKKIIIR